MPDHKTKFSQSWLNKADGNGDLVKTWLKQGSSQTRFICSICRTGDLDCSKKRLELSNIHKANSTKEIQML